MVFDQIGKGLARAHQCRYRDGLMVAMLAVRSIMRLGCFVAMELDRHIAKRNDVYVCHFDGPETKNGDPLDFELPARLIPFIETYLDTYRATLLRGKSSKFFWISTYRGPMSEISVRYRVRDATREEVGVGISPHFFRDCTATFVAEEHPEYVGIVPRLLHHRSARSAEVHYNLADGISASRQMNKVLLELRQQALAKNQRRKRGAKKGD